MVVLYLAGDPDFVALVQILLEVDNFRNGSCVQAMHDYFVANYEAYCHISVSGKKYKFGHLQSCTYKAVNLLCIYGTSTLKLQCTVIKGSKR